jgi:hypothetical protein
MGTSKISLVLVEIKVRFHDEAAQRHCKVSYVDHTSTQKSEQTKLIQEAKQFTISS